MATVATEFARMLIPAALMVGFTTAVFAAETVAPGPPKILAGDLRGTIVTVTRNEAGELSIALQLENTSEKDLRIALVGPRPFALDNTGGQYELQRFHGIAMCNNLDNDHVEDCLGLNIHYLPVGRMTPLPPTSKTTSETIVIFTFDNKQGSSGDVFRFSSNLAVLEVTSAPGKELRGNVSAVGLGTSNLRISAPSQ